METQNLRQNLLSQETEETHYQDAQRAVRARRFTIALNYHRNVQQFGNDLRASSIDRLIRSQIVDNWSEEQLVNRMSIFNDVDINQQNPDSSNQQAPVVQEPVPAAVINKSPHRITLTESLNTRLQKKRELNNRIFKLGKKTQKFLYIFNLIFNTAFRASLVIILIIELLEKKQNTIPTAVLLGLEGVCILLYFMAMTKILYTKSSEISVFFQKEFYEKPYAEIFMERVLRKHFTFYKFRSNFINFVNPCTAFNWNLKISLIRQEIFKRMEMVLVGIPLVICYAFDIPWFNLELQETEDNSGSIKTGIVMSIVLISEFFRLTVHYLVIYIFS